MAERWTPDGDQSGRAGQTVETQGTHRGDGVAVGIEAHHYGVVVQGHGGHQQLGWGLG